MAEERRIPPPPSRRRDKPQLSCNLCRRRKLRCDRGNPCGTCRHRGLSLSCTYPGPGDTRHITKKSPQSNTSGLIERIGQLENLLAAFVNDAGKRTPGQPDSHDALSGENEHRESDMKPDTSTDSSDSFGHISMRDNKPTYVQDTHWTAILDGIAELKNSVHDETVALPGQSDSFRSPEVLFPSCQPATQGEILGELPPRETCDRFVAEYFNTSSLPLIHGPSFLRQYEAFWENPLATHIMWVGKLYGIICLAVIFQGRDEPYSQDRAALVEKFDQKIKQCLVLGRYQDCPPGTIEALCCTLTAQSHQSGDGEMSSLVIMGVLARMAQRMGYHRDAFHFPHISPFHGEMRRRVWAMITDLDVMMSLSIGLPRLIREFQSDTAPPRNLLDEDFDEDSPELPPSRPYAFQTPCQWLITKHKLTSMLGIVTDFSTSIRRPSYPEVMRLDKMLHETYLSSPKNALERPLNQSLLDTSETILHRIQLVVLFSKARCLLHYRYLASARSDSRYAYSRDSCIEASLKILGYQHLMNQESQTNGRLHRERWKVRSPLMRGVFMLATTLICLELNYELSSDSTANKKHIKLPTEIKDMLIQALSTSRSIWIEQRDLHPDVPRTIQAIDLVFDKLEAQKKATTSTEVIGNASLSSEQPCSMPTTDFISETNHSLWSDYDGAMFLNQAMNIPLHQTSDPNSPVPSFHIAPELLDLTNSVDEMLGLSMNFPRTTEF